MLQEITPGYAVFQKVSQRRTVVECRCEILHRPDVIPVAHPTVSEHWGKMYVYVELSGVGGGRSATERQSLHIQYVHVDRTLSLNRTLSLDD